VRELAYHGVPAEDDYGYAQAIKIGNMIYVSGQLSHDDKGGMIAPAALDETGKPADFSMMAEQRVLEGVI
jgi:enamine deaminase RidA (YjgF/YER057c/UK114 family)